MLRFCEIIGLTSIVFALGFGGHCAYDAKENTCFAGTTIKKVTASGIDECCQACQATAQCTHFTFSDSSECGIKSGTPVNSTHTHCTSGVLKGPPPSPSPPAPPSPTPPAPPAPPPSPTPPTSGAKYQLDGKCLSIGDSAGHDPNNFQVIMTDCADAVEWTEDFTKKEPKFGHPEISANWSKSHDGRVCLTLAPKVPVQTNRCEDNRKGNERVALRNYWDPERNAIIGVFKNPDYCMDTDGDELVTKLCSETSKWSRIGPPGPKPPLPPPGQPTPAPLVGNYSLFWPLAGGVTGINEKGYPDYWGNNQAEACPPDRRTAEFGGQCNWPEREIVPLYHAKHLPHDGGNITRSMVVQRAIVWVANHFAGYDVQNKTDAINIEGCSQGESHNVCPQYFHGGACCSLPSMAWNISGCVVHGPGGHGEKIKCEDMRPGDAISFGGHHVALFAKWTREEEKHWFYMYEKNGGARVAQRGWDKGTSICMRRKNLIEDVEPHNIPPALPDDDTENRLIV